MNTKKIEEYKAFKKFLSDIESGKEPIIIGETYILISRKHYDRAQAEYANYMQTLRHISSKVN